ncbi:MAG: FAD-dependent oxidoreductase [Pseudomonadota bacterium]
MSTRADVSILGAGIAGLAAAKHLHDQNLSAHIFEAADEVGGLLAGFTVDGFRFDQAVHLSFATEPEVRAVFDQTPYHTHKPESLNWDVDKWLRHPVQNNMFPLPTDEKTDLIRGLVDQTDGPIHNYRDWLVQQYGKPIAERWPLQYTRKYWRLDASRLGTGWIGSRMRRADLSEVLRGAMSEDKSNTYYVKEMRYPEEGGYFSFIEPLVDPATVSLSHRAQRINTDDRVVHFDNGETHHYRRLISTIPLPMLIAMAENAPDELKRKAQTLVATQIDLVSVGFSKPDVSPALWFYIYDEDIEAARAYSPSWKSPANAPAGCSSLQFEIYSLPDEKVDRSEAFLKENVLYSLKKMRLADDNDILFMHHKRISHGNVVFTLGMEEIRAELLAWLSTQDIEVAGRFGCWGYIWSNQAFMSGLSAANRVSQTT